MAYIDDELDLDEDDNFGETEVPDFRDYRLKLDAGKTDGKDFVVARFQSYVPNLQDTQHVRMFRDGEDTVRKRTEQMRAEEKHEEQQQNSVLKDARSKRVIRPTKSKKFQQRKSLYPRHLKKWNLELSNETTDADANPILETQTFTGTYENTGDGKSNFQYAYLVLNDDDTIDVVPVGERAWYFFRARQHKTQSLEDVEGKQKTQADRDDKRLGALETKYQTSQAKAEVMMGSIAVETKPSITRTAAMNLSVSAEEGAIRPKKARRVKSEQAEEVDFEHTFDDDDLQQEGSDAEKPEPAEVQASNEWQKNEEDPMAGPGSDSEGEGPPRLSSEGMEMARLLEKEDRAEGSGPRSPGRPGSPATSSQWSRSPNRSPPRSPRENARGKGSKRSGNAYDSDQSAKRVRR